MDGHGVERIGRNVERLVGLLGGASGIVVFKRQARQEHARLCQLGIGDERRLASSTALAFEFLSRHQRQAEQRARVILLDWSASSKSLAASALLNLSRNSRPQRTR